MRLHHSLGDGVSLIRLFLEIVADKETPSDHHDEITKSKITKISGFQKSKNWCYGLMRGFSSIQSKAMIKSPAILIYQGLLHEIDENCLHYSKLTGEKVEL